MQHINISEDNLEERLKNTVSSGAVPTLYANGFLIFIGQSDVGVVLQTNGRDVCVLNMSFTLAKTMVEKLGITVRGFEENTGNIIMTTDFIQKKMSEHPVKHNNEEDENAGTH